ncbi:hypothetical protein TcG_08209 [Trypanosoma cruzi]|nr:hypothetical protein TcG_08209 [Trypanosoma cruzi]
MDKKERSTTSSSSTSFSQPTDMATSPQPAQGAHSHTTKPPAEADPQPSTTRRHEFTLPSRPQRDAAPHSMRSHAVHHTRGKGESGCALPPSSLLFTATEEDNSRHTQLPACTTKEASKSTAMCILCACVAVCACRNTNQNIRKKGAEYAEGRAKNAQRRCTAETTTTRPLKLMTALQPKQWQPRQNLFETKQTLPFILYKLHHTK